MGQLKCFFRLLIEYSSTLCIIQINWIGKMFSRVPQLFVGLVREKTHSIAMSRKDKSLGDAV